VRIIAWRTILGTRGVLNSFLLGIGVIREPLSFLLYNRFAVAITLTYICIPFVFIPVYTALEKIPRNILEASNDLGAGELRTFLNVVLPLSLPGLVTGSSSPSSSPWATTSSPAAGRHAGDHVRQPDLEPVRLRLQLAAGGGAGLHPVRHRRADSDPDLPLWLH
jgi:hypothetical protein